eukprot:m.155221 g.155221  ORF g.155221 m.155221 type:complete len:252 (-) comp17934_c0_seq4:270-1025(-)
MIVSLKWFLPFKNTQQRVDTWIGNKYSLGFTHAPIFAPCNIVLWNVPLAAFRYGTTSHPGQDCSGYMIEMQVSDVAQVERVWTERGKRIILRPGRSADGRPIAYERDGNVHIPGLSGLHWHPKDIGVIMETAEHHPPEAWLYAGESWMSESRHRAVGLGFAAVEVAVDDPASMASEWSSGLQRPLSATGCGIVLADGAEVRFRRRRNSREDGLVGMDIWAAHDGHVGRVFDLCGVAVRLVQHTGGKLQSAL